MLHVNPFATLQPCLHSLALAVCLLGFAAATSVRSSHTETSDTDQSCSGPSRALHVRRPDLVQSFGSRKLPPSGPKRALAGATVAEGFLASCAMAPSSHGALRWKGFEKYVHRESCEHGPQPYLQRQQVCIIGLWGEKSDDDLLQSGRKESCFLFAVGANGELREVSGLRFLHCRAWMRKAAKKGCESEFFFLVQWDSWHSSWVWTAAAAALEPKLEESGDA